MSKNTGSSQFRRVDVDAFNEDNFQDDQSESDTESGPNESEVNNLLAAKKNEEALKAILKNAPGYSNNAEVKAKAYSLVLRVLTSFKVGEIEKAVKASDTNDLDLLMKYIYRGFEEPTESSCGILLTWHEKVYAVAGIGSIMRVLTSRKSV